MRMCVKLAAGAAAMGGLALAAPAAAQAPYYPYAYPPQAYPQQAYPYAQQYPGQQGYAQNPVGAIIAQLLGNRYNVTDRTAVSQCASAAMAQAHAQYAQRGYNAYDHGYAQGYGYAPASMIRVTAITSVERRPNGLRVTGMMSNGAGYGGYGNQGYGYGNQGYGYGNEGYGADPRYAARGNLSFRCNVDYRGTVTNVRIRRA